MKAVVNGGEDISIKVRPVGGCFHREHSPAAYAIIDEQLARMPPSPNGFRFEEHESGPEIITAIAAGIALTAAVIELVTAIINARTEGIKRGDSKTESVELIVRDPDKTKGVPEKVALRVDTGNRVSVDVVIESLIKAEPRLTGSTPSKKKKPKSSRTSKRSPRKKKR